MDKNAIKKYAVWARRELIERVSQRAMVYGISAEDSGDPSADSVNGKLLSLAEKRQRQDLIRNIKEKGYEQVMEEVAYTWFNRFAALRFMEVNGYLPSHIRVFTNDAGEFKPQILSEAIHLELDGLDMNKVYELESANKSEELFKYLLIVQCNALNSILPGMFQRIDDYTELLLPDYLLREGSVLEQLVEAIPEDNWMDQVQIIGWLYQYYISEKKDVVFAALKKKVRITKENIPAATQLFTPDWIVHYMVENSLGRIYVNKRMTEGVFADGRGLDEMTWEGAEEERISKEQDIAEQMGWKYYLPEAKQEPEVREQLSIINRDFSSLKPEEIRVIDPCMGSGHILCVLFDVLVQIYEAYGYTSREAAVKIVENNLWGLDIDERAAQLSYFAVMMKARQYDRRFFTRKVQPHVYAIEESNGITSAPMHDMGLHLTQEEYAEAVKQAMRLVEEMHDAKEYGSIIHVTPCDWDLLRRFAVPRDEDGQLHLDIHGEIETSTRLQKLINIGEALALRYDAVVTNPPYMSAAGMNESLQEYVKKCYPNGKADMFAVFVECVAKMTKRDGFYGMITQPSILFLASFEKLRRQILENESISSLIHMGRGIFGIDWGSTSFIIRKSHIGDYIGNYFKPHDRTFQYIDPNDIEQFVLTAKENPEYRYDFSKYTGSIETEDADQGEEEIEEESLAQKIYFSFKQADFLLIPGCPIAFSMSTKLLAAFKGATIKDMGFAGIGMRTGDNAKYLRLWPEIDYTKMCVDAISADDAVERGAKWIPYNKGGDYRKWFGNNSYVVNWENNGFEIKENTKKVYPYLGDNLGWKISNEGYYFKPGITWSGVCSGAFSCRNYGVGFIFDSGANGLFAYKEEDGYYLAGLLNTNLARMVLQILNPTINTGAGTINNVPAIDSNEIKAEVVALVRENISLAKADWDSTETSWDFKRHPFLNYHTDSVEEAYRQFSLEITERFNTLRQNEERINQIFNLLYGVEQDVPSSVPDKLIALRKPDLAQDIRAFISYAVGCMFGRFSLDEEGIAYAGGAWHPEKYSTFIPDKDAIIPICDDEYFEDDIVGLFVKFLTSAFGERRLEENLSFIAAGLGGKGSSREVLRDYFLNVFYADHCSTYSVTSSGKRPIYWLFDSGKKNGFKCLIYMHRYQPDTIARIRTDYVHEQQSRYRTAIADLEQRINGASTSERVKLSKQISKLQAQASELLKYEEKIHHLADQMIKIDLDDGVKHNYEIFKDVLAKIK